MNNLIDDFANEFIKNHRNLNDSEQQVLLRLRQRSHISRNTNTEMDEASTIGQKLADRIAIFGGSWTFILLFIGLLVLWIALNTLILTRGVDPYPFVFLNLILSMLAALQAPIILMSQNRSAAKDRAAAQHDYEVNLKAELEVMALHQKVDVLRETQWAELITLQQQQIAQLTQLLKQSTARTNQ
ncbi:DUF1003 domain-containing protein [Deefgea rivuli]|uniref:DUF1003 domain-containing protein n=1 Tax=Deefgea rivuli TaxID=400948 RepID=UPI000686ED58|nr:DUF1003 domain-containing protein [Deefgea rivuli]